MTTEKQEGPAPLGREFLAFALDQEEYGVEILRVQEIRGYEAVTRIANAPQWLKGVMNLRGTIVPIVDLRIKFNVPNPTYNDFTVVIIVKSMGRTVGLVVDGVSDVVHLPVEQIAPPPDFGTAVDARFITGLGTANERMLILVDLDRLLALGELALFNEIDLAHAA